MDSISSLIRAVKKAGDDARYERAREKWEAFWSRKRKVIPVYAHPCEGSFWAEYFNCDWVEYYTNPEKRVEIELKRKLFWHENIFDDGIMTPNIGLWMGTGFEASIFGVKLKFQHHMDPPLGDPIIKDWSDLNNLNYPDFYTSGSMPQLHKFYRGIKKFVGNKIKVFFPGWGRAPFGLAVHLRGMQNILLDMYDNPDKLHQLMDFCVKSIIRWEIQRANFLNLEVKEGAFGNDEVDCNLISPRQYHEYIYPYEKRLAKFYRSIYYHSCGNLTPILSDIFSLPNLKILHVSPWTDFLEAVKSTNSEIFLQKCMDPVNDIIMADKETMRNKIIKLIEKGGNTFFYFQVDGIGTTQHNSVDKIKQWVNIAKEILDHQKYFTSV